MYITARERQILEKLLLSKEELTVKNIAEVIDVSVRTIHRDLKGIEDILKEYDLTLVKKSGVGVQIKGAEKDIENLKLFLFNLTHHEYSQEERQTIIICSLLESTEPVKLIALANDLNVTIATISNDLNKIEESLEKYKSLSLVRKRGYGVEIAGDETSKRKAMSNIIMENVAEYDLLTLIRENIQKKTKQQSDSISKRLLGLVEKRNLLIVEKVMEEINKELPYSIADSAYVGLVVHLALAMERIVRGENISIDQAYLEKLQTTAEFHIAEKISERLELVFQCSIPKAEIGYITMHLLGAKLRHDKEYLIEETSLQIALKAKSLIQYVEKKIGQPLQSNHSLLQGLVAHLNPAIFRMKQNMGITNPLLPKIKKDYNELFQIVKDGVKVVLSDLEVPDEEVGYLVLHFGSVLLGESEKKSLSALVVCSTGIGTSKMLSTRLQKEIPSIKEVRNVSLFELHRSNKDHYDLILSTIRIPELEEQDYILVNPFLTNTEVEKIKSYLRHSVNHKNLMIEDFYTETISKRELVLSRLQTYQAYVQTIIAIINDFQVRKGHVRHDIKELLQEACVDLFERGIITDTSTVLDDLLRREQVGGLGIPNTKLALYHTRSDKVSKPSFSIIALSKPIHLEAMDQSTMEVESILLMLSPNDITSAELEVLSHISALIIEDDFSIVRFESQDELKISSYLISKLEKFLYEQTLKRSE
ncbi:BglG family transcription antiterminator [Halalkalibacter akibai]|uniref:Mannitol operon activator n=1 Tax=Halalkalibacter akibai (strain ATCC 43226 / DSM 21942 / CIP 109018 / JCM 9157 / 1139) TaxID=1236973 RepID=W4QXQ2_HALA3|nr:PRD domain-containing protein [Halalkalibacter akibai]GAE36876.1 mannitol operon activator [Halalkalibacter akibai JCM 9157]